MAPYSGDVKDVDVTKLKFFKIDEAGFDKKARLWASDKMIKRGNKWTTTLPWDIKPGKYIVRHETIALHFVDPTDPVAWGQGGPGAQVRHPVLRFGLRLTYFGGRFT
jgi:hypothetical protein